MHTAKPLKAQTAPPSLGNLLVDLGRRADSNSSLGLGTKLCPFGLEGLFLGTSALKRGICKGPEAGVRGGV